MMLKTMRLWMAFGRAICIGALAACTPGPRPAPVGLFAIMPRASTRCHVPASGKPEELAERGIGGTGGATRPPPPEPIRPSLGVSGIIDGFGSVCLNGLEVGLLPGTTVMADGAPASAADLRIGQQAVLAAAWADGRPVTDRLLIRHTVIGPLERVDGKHLVVAGQPVTLSAAVWIAAPLRQGAWVSVSGLRAPSGEVLASRLDPASGPAVLIHGRLAGTAAQPRIGALAVMLSGQRAPVGSDVVLRGIERDGAVRVTELRPDLLVDDPVSSFGGQIHHFLIQSLIGSGSHPLASLNLGLALPPGTALTPGSLPSVVGVTAPPSGTPTAQPPNTGVGGWAGPPGGGPAHPDRFGPSAPGKGMAPAHPARAGRAAPGGRIGR